MGGRGERGIMDWITEEMPEKEGSYLVTWKGKLWIDSYMGFCEFDGESRTRIGRGYA